MIKRFSVILLFAVYAACSLLMAQTPFDSFSPETSRPMLVMEDEASMRQQHVETSSDSMRYAVIVDIQQQTVYLADLSEERILAIAPLTEEMRHWLSVDPLSDKYPNISPYAYCGWNPIRFVDPDGMDTINIVQKDNVWSIRNVSIAHGNDVFTLQFQDGSVSKYEFSEGEYGKRVNCLNIENTGKEGYTLGVYHVSGARCGGTGFYVNPGGEASNSEGSGKRIKEGTYPLNAPSPGAKWLLPGVGGCVVSRGIRFHYGANDPVKWTSGCFVLFPRYSINSEGNIQIEKGLSIDAAIDFAHHMGGMGCINYITTGGKSRTGVANYPYGIQDLLYLQSR